MGIKRKEGDGQKAGGSADQMVWDCSDPEGQTGKVGIGDLARKAWAWQPGLLTWRAKPDCGGAPEVFSFYWAAFSLQVPGRKESSFLIDQN